MVSRKTNQSQAVKKRSLLIYRIKLGISFALLGISITSFTFIFCFLIANQFNTGTLTISSSSSETDTDLSKEPEKEYAKIDFQPVVDEWVKKQSGNKSVLIYDLDRDEMVGEYNPTESYSTASLYKLFVVYEGYRRLQSGTWDTKTRVAAGYDTLKCLDLAVRESYSPCAEALWSKIGRSELDRIIEDDFKIMDSDISHLLSNPQDILAMMKIFYYHEDISEENLVATMKDSFLNQPKTTYDWRQGLPSGFSKANVYNKVGWDYNPDIKNWNIYHDAAIVEFPEEDRHFIVVVMTNRVPYQKIRELGTAIEKHFYENV